MRCGSLIVKHSKKSLNGVSGILTSNFAWAVSTSLRSYPRLIFRHRLAKNSNIHLQKTFHIFLLSVKSIKPAKFGENEKYDQFSESILHGCIAQILELPKSLKMMPSSNQFPLNETLKILNFLVFRGRLRGRLNFDFVLS